MNAVRPSSITGYRSGRYSWDLHGLLRTGQITLNQVLDAFQFDYDPVFKVHRRPVEPSVPRPGQMTYCKGR